MIATDGFDDADDDVDILMGSEKDETRFVTERKIDIWSNDELNPSALIETYGLLRNFDCYTSSSNGE